jgi:NADP-dependent 3-hydroxy acid dehydrogenase YdfG
MENLQNKNVVIAGATGGIGHALAKLVKNSRANVYLTGRDAEALKRVAKDVGISSDQTYLLDITNHSEVLATAEQINQATGEQGVDILVNATGVGIIKPLDDLTFEDFSNSLDVNLKGAFSLLKGFVPGMKKRKQGLIINLPGVLGKTPMAGASAYAASKYGLNGMLKSVREELKRTQVRITNLYLGGTDTAFWDTIDMRVQRDKFVTVDEAARSIWFLCQQPSSGVVSEMVLQPFNHQAI